MQETSLPKKLSTIIIILNAIVAEAAVLVFLQDYWAITTVLLVCIVLWFRSAAPAFIIEFLVALAFNFWTKGQTAELRTTILILSVPVLLQLIPFAASQLIKGWQGFPASFGQNLIFALIGEAIVLAYSFVIYTPYFDSVSGGSQGIFVQLFVGVPLAKGQELVSLLKLIPYRGVTLETIKIVLNTVCAAILLSPLVWGPLFAVLRQKGFSISKLSSIVIRTLLVAVTNWFSMQIIGAGLGLALIALTPCVTVWLSSQAQNMPLPDSQFDSEAFLATVVAILLFAQSIFTAFFSAWAAQWGEKTNSQSAVHTISLSDQRRG